MSPNLSLTPSLRVESGSSILMFDWPSIIAVLFPGADGSDIDACPLMRDAEEPKERSNMLIAFFSSCIDSPKSVG